MRRAIFVAALSAAATSCTSAEVPTAYADTKTATPIVVELFSSEGCSSCPPADAVLRELAAKQGVEGATVVAIELHVDYWNDLGWADPFSDSKFTARQRAYAQKNGKSGVYTPQMIVDGGAEFVGSHASEAKREIAAAAKLPHATIELSRAGDALHVEASGVDDAGEGADVMLAIVEEGLSTAVPRGENAGSTLEHGPIARKLVKIGEASGSSYRGDTSVALSSNVKRDHARAIVFVQRKKSLRVVGAQSMALK